MNWYLKVLKQYADFKGRARRKEYWMFSLINAIITYTIIYIEFLLDMSEPGILDILYSLVLMIPSIAVGVRRMHDTGKSGWYLLIPFYNLILACTDSEHGTNKWGDNPKGIGNDDIIDQIGTE